MMGAVAAVVVVVGIVAVVAVSRRPTVPVPELSDCAGVVRVVAEERISNDDADRVAAGLGPCLEPISDVAWYQHNEVTPKDANPQGLGRPGVMAMFKNLAEDVARREKLRASFVVWSRLQLATFSDGPQVAWADGRNAVDPVWVVLASAASGVEAVDQGEGPRFVELTIADIKFDIAARLAQKRGERAPNREGADQALVDQFPPGTAADGRVEPNPTTPFEFLSARARAEAERKLPESWW